jgi:uncharacterized protein (TIGR02246 family)
VANPLNENLLDRVVEVYHRLLERWNERDAEGFAALFVDGGHAIGFDGSGMDGRAEIASTLAAVFQNERTGTYVSTVREVREIAPGVILLRSIVAMVPPDSVNLNLSVQALQSVVFVQREDGHRDDGLRIVLLQSTPAAFHGRPEVAELLALELEAARRSQRIKH